MALRKRQRVSPAPSVVEVEQLEPDEPPIDPFQDALEVLEGDDSELLVDPVQDALGALEGDRDELLVDVFPGRSRHRAACRSLPGRSRGCG